MQALTKLYLYKNQIGDTGTQHVVEALKMNKLRH